MSASQVLCETHAVLMAATGHHGSKVCATHQRRGLRHAGLGTNSHLRGGNTSFGIMSSYEQLVDSLVAGAVAADA